MSDVASDVLERGFPAQRAVEQVRDEADLIASTGPRQVGFTLNSDTPYGAATLDLSQGPMVIELPPGPYIGLVDDHHQRWCSTWVSRDPIKARAASMSYSRQAMTRTCPATVTSGARSFKVLLAVRALSVGGDLGKALVCVYPDLRT